MSEVLEGATTPPNSEKPGAPFCAKIRETETVSGHRSIVVGTTHFSGDIDRRTLGSNVAVEMGDEGVRGRACDGVLTKLVWRSSDETCLKAARNPNLDEAPCT